MLSAVAARKAAKKAEQEVKAAEEAAQKASNQRRTGSKDKSVVSGKLTLATVPTGISKKRKVPRETETNEPGNTVDSSKTRNEDSTAGSLPINDVAVSEAGPSEPMKKKPRRAWSPSQLITSAVEEDGDNDEDSDDDAVLDLGPSATREASEERSHRVPAASTFRPIVGQNTFPASFTKSSPSSGTLVILKWAQEESIVFTGAVRLTLIVGYLSVFGTEIAPGQSNPVFASTLGPLPTLRHSRSQHAVSSADIDLDALEALPKEVKDEWRMGDTVLLLESMSETRVAGLGDVVGTCEGMFGDNSWDGFSSDLGVEGFHLVLKHHPGIHTFSAPVPWMDAIGQMVEIPPQGPKAGTPRTVVLVRGPKRSGKSTFARTTMNCMLSRYEQVAYLDCDVGQSEFGPGGTVGLYLVAEPQFGLPCTHPRRPLAAHYIGSMSPCSNPSHYISAIGSLLQVFRGEIQFGSVSPTDELSGRGTSSRHRPATKISSIIPLIINTHGWVKGMGADLARQIEELAQPTHIFELLPRPSDKEMDLYGFEGGPSGRNTGERVLLSEVPGTTVWGDDLTNGPGFLSAELPKVFSLPPGPLPGPGSYFSKPEELRDLGIMSYFHSQLEAGTWRTDVALSAVPPYEVDAAGAFDAIILTGSGSEDVVVEELARVLNGSVVALVEADEPKAILSLSKGHAIPYVQGAAPPDPLTSRCLGLGFIRASRSPTPTSLQIHIVTPLPQDEVVRCRVLVKGEIDMPIWASIGSSSSVEGREWKNGRLHGVGWEDTPYLAYRRPQGSGQSSKPLGTIPIGGDVKKGRKNVRRAAQV